MNQQFEILDKKFINLSETDLILVEGGDWSGEGLVRAIFEIGRETGRAIRGWLRPQGELMKNVIASVKKMDVIQIIQYLVALILLPGIIRGVFYVGREVGRTIFSWF